MSDRISTGKVHVKSIKPANGVPIKEDWRGKGELEGELVTLATEIDSIEAGHEYAVVYERITLSGENMIVIHELINEETSTNASTELPSD